MSDDEIADLIREMMRLSTKYGRRQLFNWSTRHLSPEQRQIVEQKVRERWNEQKP